MNTDTSLISEALELLKATEDRRWEPDGSPRQRNLRLARVRAARAMLDAFEARERVVSLTNEPQDVPAGVREAIEKAVPLHDPSEKGSVTNLLRKCMGSTGPLESPRDDNVILYVRFGTIADLQHALAAALDKLDELRATTK